MEAETGPAEEVSLTYAEFGTGFFEHAVTEERILAGMTGLAGEEIEFGPIGAGPGRLAQVSASGVVGDASAQRVRHAAVAFRLLIPVTFELFIDLGVDKHRFHVDVEVGLTLTARAAPPLRLVIEVDEPTWRDVTVTVQAEGLRASVLQRVAGVDREIGRFVARYVARELDKPHIRAARDIDIAGRIDRAWVT